MLANAAMLDSLCSPALLPFSLSSPEIPFFLITPSSPPAPPQRPPSSPPAPPSSPALLLLSFCFPLLSTAPLAPLALLALLARSPRDPCETPARPLRNSCETPTKPLRNPCKTPCETPARPLRDPRETLLSCLPSCTFASTIHLFSLLEHQTILYGGGQHRLGRLLQPPRHSPSTRCFHFPLAFASPFLSCLTPPFHTFPHLSTHISAPHIRRSSAGLTSTFAPACHPSGCLCIRPSCTDADLG